MKAHDARRTGQSAINGPMEISEARTWSTEIPVAVKLNIGATVTRSGAYFGSWGLQRRDPEGRDQLLFDSDEVPDGFACTFYGLKGPRGRISR